MLTLKRAAAAMSLAVLPLSLPTTAHARAAAPEVLPIGVAVSALQVADESRVGYTRTAFKHWTAGDNATDGCNTRQEVLIAEAVVAPEIGPRCTLTGGTWTSYYDESTVDGAGGLDIDHMVPLAEAWDSGASSWTAARREAYANDQGQASSLVAVTARSNRSKSDQDPAEWLPPSSDALCRYGAEWTATKLRWGLAVDELEKYRLQQIAAGCGGDSVTFTPAP
ncbi:HNH endonuclease family protein [Streptomyces sp. Isolate_45]|uniref:HNH endonuclease family protein n=1 Tax=Streptomyces sp. Isolate_45 TaxID=2950111 RepID=UPI002481FF62|nr:HNH endonuclease family protein [Streptomyces sp. Isolate_45]MDA5279930.1 HNH endonuclease family protein [Streptomyces sp. Isolate_45]